MRVLPYKFRETLEAVLYIALHAGGQPVSGKAICSYQNVASRHLEPGLQLLVKHGILHGSKGPKGGYSLAKEKRRITLEDILVICLELEHHLKQHQTTELARKVMEPYLSGVEQQLSTILQKTTIEDLCNEAKLLPGSGKELDFII